MSNWMPGRLDPTSRIRDLSTPPEKDQPDPRPRRRVPKPPQEAEPEEGETAERPDHLFEDEV